MTLPEKLHPNTPEPARAEPEDFRRPDTISLGGRTLKIAGSVIGGGGEFYDYAVRLTPEEICALAPAPDAGLAEVERLIQTYAAANINWAHDPDSYFGRLNSAHSALVDAFAAQAATIAALRAERDRLRADAAGRGEGVSAELRALSEKATSCSNFHLGTTPPDNERSVIGYRHDEPHPGVYAIPEIMIYTDDGEGGLSEWWIENDSEISVDAPLLWAEVPKPSDKTIAAACKVRAARARIAAVSAPATDGTGGRSDG